ncbi:LPXTG cell wall anchor domain-containing protein [Microbacterium sulfonylureivorans]|uniref:LPXTG cell wall anchor domain-containing protein n=1 Tax=Microbacterium sulfonylureivorans TaxID=2486854 RepID=UPI0013DFC3D6|nr:LPXTG cell wall anchor domain-containing protein [Microbacterium sulfonylureivorans]
MRKIVLSAFAIAAALILLPTAANAVTPGVQGGVLTSEDDDGYTPTQHQAPTLGGSTAVGECDRDVPWILYAVTLTDPDNQATSHTARLVLTDGVNSTTLELGELVDGELSGRVLWPGASVDDEGNATGWPGWAYVDGQWVEIDGNFGWTRGDITATIEVNPEVGVPLSYPPATPQCDTSPENSVVAGLLPATGLGQSLLPIGIVGGALAFGGIILLAVRRRHRAKG